MKVYIIFDVDGWEILGISKCFDSYEKASRFLDAFKYLYEDKPRSLLNKPISFDDWKKQFISIQTVE
jgi:hypothetical protein